MNQQGQVQGIDKIVLVDSVGSMTGSFFGTGTVTFLLESIAGLKAGGRGPWTAITIAALSTGSLFLYPLLATIPHYATSFLLVAIGGFMLGACRQIPWRKWSDALPAAAILITIPLTFSIYKGLAAGFVLFVLCKTMAQEKDALHPLVIGLSTLFIFHYFIF
jgi:AGZA family xanthine/uracil permease-like MFS transporter